MPLEGNAEMIVWRQAVDTELRLANQWEERMDGSTFSGFYYAYFFEKKKRRFL